MRSFRTLYFEYDFALSAACELDLIQTKQLTIVKNTHSSCSVMQTGNVLKAVAFLDSKISFGGLNLENSAADRLFSTSPDLTM